MDALITFIIPVFNSYDYLNSCLSSLPENYSDMVEAIIINDCSTDNSLEIIAEFNEKTKINCTIVNNVENRGLSYNRNLGISLATGKYIIFLDSDDMVDAENFDLIVKHLYTTNADIIKAGAKYYFDESGQPYIVSAPTEKFFSLPLRDVSTKKYKLLALVDIVPQLILAKEFLNKPPIRFDETISSREDRQFIFEVLGRANSIDVISENLYLYRLGNNASTATMRQLRGEKEIFNLHSQANRIAELCHDDTFIPGSEFLETFFAYYLVAFVEGWGDNYIFNMGMSDFVKYLEPFSNLFSCVELFPDNFKTGYFKYINDDFVSNGYYYLWYYFIINKNYNALYELSTKKNIEKDFISSKEYSELGRYLNIDALVSKESSAIENKKGIDKLEKIKIKSNKNIKKVVLHIGTTKTGSTTLQNFCKINADSLLNEGIYFPADRLVFQGGRQYRTPGHIGLIKAIKNLDYTYLDSIFGEIEGFEKCHTILLSSENLFINTCIFPQFVEHAKKLFLDIDVEILVYFRRQDHWVASQYAEHVMGGNQYYEKSISEFTDECFRSGFLDYYAIACEWGRYFGMENVKVKNYDSLKINNSLLEDFLNTVLGVGSKRKDFDLPDLTNSNKSFSAEDVMLFRLINKVHGNKKELIDVIDSLYRSRIQDNEGGRYRNDSSTTELICDALRKRIKDHCDQKNKLLSDHFLNSEEALVILEKSNVTKNSEILVEASRIDHYSRILDSFKRESSETAKISGPQSSQSRFKGLLSYEESMVLIFYHIKTLRYGRCFVYGAGEVGEAFSRVSGAMDSEFEFIFVDKRASKDNNVYLGRPMLRLRDISPKASDIFIAASFDFQMEMQASINSYYICHIGIHPTVILPRR